MECDVEGCPLDDDQLRDLYDYLCRHLVPQNGTVLCPHEHEVTLRWLTERNLPSTVLSYLQMEGGKCDCEIGSTVIAKLLKARATGQGTDETTNNRLLLKVPEAARMLNISRSKLYELVKHDQVPYTHIGKSLRLHRDVLNNWIKANHKWPAPAA